MTSAIETKPTPQAFGSSGGKARLAKKIGPLIPEHTTYVEPFAGGAAVYFYKEPAKKEILNDMDEEIAFAYRFLRDMTPAQYEALKRKNWVISRHQFEKVKGMKPESDVDRFYKFYYTKRGSFRHGTTSVDVGNIGHTMSLDRLPKVQARLRGVAVNRDDALAMIDKYDGPNTFFYLDPPYPDTAPIRGNAPGFSKADLASLIGRLRHIKGRFILSMDTGNGREFPAWLEKRRVKTGGHNGQHEWTNRFEVLAANFKMQPRKNGQRSNGKGRPRCGLRDRVAKALSR